jgi:putative membrane protein
VRLLPYLNEAFMIASAVSVALGWVAIRRRDVHAHRRRMLLGAALAVLFFVSYVARSLLVGDTSFGGPAGWRLPYQIFLQVHSILAVVAAVLGIVALRRAFARRFRRHRRVAPWAATLWFVAAGTGLMVFLLLYVVYPPGPTHSLLHTITGH